MAINPLAVMILPTAYIVVSVFVLMQLSVLLSLLATAAVKVRKVEALAAIQPVLLSIIDYFQRIFGPLHKFNPQPTHVLLVAVVVALVINGQRRS